MIKKEVIHNKKKLVVADPRKIELAKYADVFLQIKPGTNIAILNGLAHVALKEGLYDSEYVKNRCEGFEELEKTLQKYTPEHVAEICGIENPQDIVKAARILAQAKPMALYYCMGVTQFKSGVNGVKCCANLQMLLGNLGVAGGGVNPLRGQNNVQGACDMGGLPNVFTGYQPVTNPAAVEKFSKYWRAPLSDKVGLTLTQMVPAAGDSIRALYILGENPLVSDPNLHHVEECLAKLDFLVVQDIFLTETAKLADVVLPGVSFAEKLGTISNTERRVQLTQPAIKPTGSVRQDYEIIADVAARFGHEFPRTPEALFQEIRDLTPAYAGLTYERIREVGIQWPCPAVDHPGTRFLHSGKFARGLALLSPLAYRPPAEVPDGDFDLVLSTGRILEHFHTGSMTRRSRLLDVLVEAGHVELHPDDATRYGVADGDRVAVSTRRGRIETTALVTDRVAPGSIFVPFHFAEAAANVLTNDVLDPVAKIPEYKVCAASLERVGSGR